MQKRFDMIITHERPHLDEITAIWLLRKFGEEKFPGISTAKIEYRDSSVLCEYSIEAYEREGILLVGIGGGRFDEHPTVNGSRKEDECCATLVAKELGLEEEPTLKPILKFVRNEDLGGGQQFDLAGIVKLLHEQFPNDPGKVIDWAIMGLEAKYYDGFQFWNSAKEEFERHAVVESFVSQKGETLKMASITSDNEQVAKFARSVVGGNAAVVIQKKLSGNIQIYTNRRFGVDLYDVVRMIRLEEQKAKGNVVISEWRALSNEGKVVGSEEWFFHEAGQMLLNGSLTAKDVPATRIPFSRIVELVRIGVSKSFEPKRAKICLQSVCSSAPGNKCLWYDFGLQRCRVIRGLMKASSYKK